MKQVSQYLSAVCLLASLAASPGRAEEPAGSGQRPWIVTRFSLNDPSGASDRNVADFDAKGEAHVDAHRRNAEMPAAEIGQYAYLPRERGAWGELPSPIGRSRVPAVAELAPPDHTTGLVERVKQQRGRMLQTVQTMLEKKGLDVAALTARADKMADQLVLAEDSLADDVVKEAGDLASQYNAIAKQLGKGPAGLMTIEPFDRNALELLSPTMQVQLIREQVLHVLARLHGLQLRLRKRDLEQARSEIILAAKQIETDKAAQVNLGQREQRLDQALDVFDDVKSDFEDRLDFYDAVRDELESVREAIRNQRRLAEREKLLKQIE